MPIHPLPQFEEDLLSLEEERRAIEALRVPKTIVVRFGAMGMIGEFPYRGDGIPGCGSKIVVRTHRGIELGDMLTSTCPNAGCASSITREQMLEYIEHSGGRQYPFFRNGRALRIATHEDLHRQKQLDDSRHDLRLKARQVAARLGLELKIVEVEPILSGDRLTVYYASEDRIETRALGQELSSTFRVRVDLRQVGARDEARLVADYERCGQYCCCKNFLKVLKPISMKAAKIQKATLDPLKISGRCGRLMCCLRYEEQTYDELKRNLPRRKTRVGTPEGDGIVIDTQILTQLVLVRLDSGQDVAVPVEQLGEPGKVKPRTVETSTRKDESTSDQPARKRRRRRRRRRGDAESATEQKSSDKQTQPTPEDAGTEEQPSDKNDDGDTPAASDRPRRKKRRRRRRKPRDGDSTSSQAPES
ncbi:MAG: hypothetical protein D6695_01835 [Planctomycetota bacterium]|nr:MAG: hypothetical protein D6695_01835 [Planctomycetota bacterium]